MVGMLSCGYTFVAGLKDASMDLLICLSSMACSVALMSRLPFQTAYLRRRLKLWTSDLRLLPKGEQHWPPSFKAVAKQHPRGKTLTDAGAQSLTKTRNDQME